MSKNCGKAVLLYMEDPASPGTYLLVGGMEANALTITKEYTEVTDKQTMPWTIKKDCGVRSAAISGNGTFEVGDAALLNLWKAIFGFASASGIANFRITFGTATTPERVTGAFSIETFERAGEFKGAETFTVSLASAGALTYEVAVP